MFNAFYSAPFTSNINLRAEALQRLRTFIVLVDPGHDSEG
jgi:hypothetical protein